jgi:hypothetical protein
MLTLMLSMDKKTSKGKELLPLNKLLKMRDKEKKLNKLSQI